VAKRETPVSCWSVPSRAQQKQLTACPGNFGGRLVCRAGRAIGGSVRLEASSTAPTGLRRRVQPHLSSFNPRNIANGTRSWGEMSRPLKANRCCVTRWTPVCRLSLSDLERLPRWNKDVYSAFGGALEQQGVLPNLGRGGTSYFWRSASATTEQPKFINGKWNRDKFRPALGAPMPSAPSTAPSNLGRGQTLPLNPGCALRYFARADRAEPGPFQHHLSADSAYSANAPIQNVLVGSPAAPPSTLGNFKGKPYFDYHPEARSPAHRRCDVGQPILAFDPGR